MKVVCISDTHNQLDKLLHKLPDADVLIHAGDFTNHGTLPEMMRVVEQLKILQPRYDKIISVPGNHDLLFEDQYTLAKMLFGEVGLCLIDQEVEYKGFKFYGSPWQPAFFDWAFNLPRHGEKLALAWDSIPTDVNILITHCPPHNILDTAITGNHIGCELLANRLSKLPDLMLHVFGHCHHSYGEVDYFSQRFANASVCAESYLPINPPIVYDLDKEYGIIQRLEFNV